MLLKLAEVSQLKEGSVATVEMLALWEIQGQVSQLVAGPKALICDECSGICGRIITEDQDFRHLRREFLQSLRRLFSSRRPQVNRAASETHQLMDA